MSYHHVCNCVGTVFVYVSWRVIIYAFEYMSSEVGRKASRYSDGSVFSFAAIYTGATFANFIFLSVEFNSGTFWALAFITAANIIIVQGGLMIDIDYFFMDYIAVWHNWPIVYTLKMLYFEKIRVIPHAMSEKIVNCGENLTPEIKLALIRSRAKVLQLNWVHNDIKMASEFQALACAATAVAFEMVYSYYGVGSDSITADLQDRPGALYIYCVNIIFSFVAQFIARRRLRHKVKLQLCALQRDTSDHRTYVFIHVFQVLRLKTEISATVKALEAGAAVVPPPVHRATSKRGSPMSILGINPLGSSNNRNSTSSTTSGSSPGNRSSARMKRGPVSMRRGSTTMFSALTGAFHPSRRDFNTADLETGGPDDEPVTEDEEEAHENDMLISEQDVDTDALNAILGLCTLYATEEMIEMESKEAGNNNSPTKAPPSPLKTANSMPFSTRRGGRGGLTSDGEDDGPKGAETRRFGKIRFVRGEDPDAEDPNIDEGEDDGWEEVQLNSNRLSATFRSSITGGLGFKQRMSTMFGGLLGTETGGAERRGSSRPVPASASTNAVRMQGYLNKRKPGTTAVYQRRFFLLTDKQLMWFASEEDVEQHINRRKGAISIASITNLDRYDPTSLCALSIAVNSGRVYVLMAIDRSCADDWYDMIQECRKGLHKTKKTGGDASEVDDFDGEALDRASTSQPNGTFFPSWFGGGGAGGVGNGGDNDKAESRSSFFGGASANYRPSLAFNLGSLGLTLGHENIHEHVEEEAGGVTQMLRRGTTNARRGLGSIFHAASTALPLVATNASAAPETAEVWKAGWDMSDLPRKMGYLQKKGEVNASWQQRWFVIGHTGNLSWYDKAGSERHQKPKGCVSMGEVVCVKGTDPEKPLLVEIRHIHGRVYQLEAGSEQDAEDWRSVLEKWVVSARSAIDKYNNEHNGVFVQGSSSNTTYDQDQEEEEEALASGVESKEADSTAAAGAPLPTVAQRKTGFMQKRGGGARSTAFKKRWFVLDHPGVLSWYEKINGEKFGKPKGFIDLCEIMCVKTASYDAPCLVEIRHVEGRVYEIEANSVQEAEDWRVALNLWLKVAYDLKKAAAKPKVSAAAAELNQDDEFAPISETEEDATVPDTPGTDNNPEVGKKKFSMYSKLGFGKSTRKAKEKYAALNTQSPAPDRSNDGSAKRSPGSPVAELDDLYPPELSATEMIESLTRERAMKAPAISPPRTVSVVRTAKFNNPLFPSTGKARSRKNPDAIEFEENAQKEPEQPKQASTTVSTAPVPAPDAAEGYLSRDHAVATSTPTKINPLVRAATAPTSSKVSFQTPSVTYNMSQDLGASGKGNKDAPFTAAAPTTPPSDVEENSRDDGSDDEEVTQYQSSLPFGRSAAPFASSAQSPTSDHSSRDSTPSLSSTSPTPQSGRRVRGGRRGSTAFSEICAKVAAQAPETLPVAAEEETVADYNRHRSSIDKVLSDRARGITAQPITEQRAKRQPVKRNNLLGGPSHVEIPTVKKVNRRESELADSKFMRRMAKRHSSELVDNLQKKSYKDMNSEFWVTHKWYLACVVCFVTLNVLYSTSYIVSQY